MSKSKLTFSQQAEKKRVHELTLKYAAEFGLTVSAMTQRVNRVGIDQAIAMGANIRKGKEGALHSHNGQTMTTKEWFATCVGTTRSLSGFQSILGKRGVAYALKWAMTYNEAASRPNINEYPKRNYYNQPPIIKRREQPQYGIKALVWGAPSDAYNDQHEGRRPLNLA